MAGNWVDLKAKAESTGMASVIRRIDYDPSTPELLDSLPSRLLIAMNPPNELRDLIAAIRNATNTTRAPRDTPLYLLSVGPVLDYPDQVMVRHFQQHGNQLIVDILFSSASLQGTQLRRNVRWRPVVQLPVSEGLSHGHYRVNVNWRPTKLFPAEDPSSAPAVSQTLTIELD